jgi:nucleoside-diphosphate-sugar epimerase
VVGPRDSTNRFWLYQMLLQYLDYTDQNGKHEILIPKAVFDKKTSYVYVKDVSRVINQLLKSDIQNEIFNIGKHFFNILYFMSLFL